MQSSYLSTSNGFVMKEQGTYKPLVVTYFFKSITPLILKQDKQIKTSWSKHKTRPKKRELVHFASFIFLLIGNMQPHVF